MHKTTNRLPFNTGVTFLLVLARNLDFRGTCCLEIFNVNPIRTRFFWFSETEVLRGRAVWAVKGAVSRNWAKLSH